MPDSSSVIVAGARTPFGRLLGSLSARSAADLGGVAIRAALARAGLAPAAVDCVIMGQVLQAGAGQLPARQAAVAAGLDMSVPAMNINTMCLSGLDAIALADQLIRAGEYEVIVAGGQESMTQAPHLLLDARHGYRYGDVEVRDHLAHDGLHDVFTDQPMGGLTDEVNEQADGFSREQQEEFAVRSHTRAALAWKNGLFEDEVTPVSIPQRRGEPVDFAVDEGIRADTTMASLSRLAPAFRPDGTITAGTSSPISDGAAAVVVMSKKQAIELGLTWLAEIGAHGRVAGPDSSLQSQPASAIEVACAKQGVEVASLRLLEINEAFAAVGLSAVRRLGVNPDIVNVNGGAIALGHPIGASGARLVLHLCLELGRRGGGIGAAALCGGGGQGSALLVTAPGH